MQVSRWWKRLAIGAIALIALQNILPVVMTTSPMSGEALTIHDDARQFAEMPSGVRYVVGFVIAMRGGSESLPNEWLPCDGRLLRQEDFPELFETIGTSYSHNGKEFRLPDYRGMFVRSQGKSLGAVSENLNIGGKTEGSPSKLVGGQEDESKHYAPVVWAMSVK